MQHCNAVATLVVTTIAIIQVKNVASDFKYVGLLMFVALHQRCTGVAHKIQNAQTLEPATTEKWNLRIRMLLLRNRNLFCFVCK